MKKIIFRNHRFLLFFTMCLTSLCWLFTLVQTVANHLFSTAEAIPAFQNHTICTSADIIK